MKVPIPPFISYERRDSELGRITENCKSHQPGLFLVGLPLNMDDSESELSTRARKFARRLRHQTNIETLMVDERLTTREARDELDHYQAQGRGKNCLRTVLLLPS